MEARPFRDHSEDELRDLLRHHEQLAIRLRREGDQLGDLGAWDEHDSKRQHALRVEHNAMQIEQEFEARRLERREAREHGQTQPAQENVNIPPGWYYWDGRQWIVPPPDR